jgi:hypothetical protein
MPPAAGQPGEWVAIYDPDAPSSKAPWTANIQDCAGCFSVEGIWFYTEADCVAWMRSTVVGAQVKL